MTAPAPVVDPTERRHNLIAVAALAAVVLVSWGAILLAPQAKFWDDWVAESDPIGLTHDVGLPWMGPIIQVLFAIGPWTFKVLGLLATIVAAVAAYAIAGRGLSLGRFERWLLAALLVALPLNTVRVSLEAVFTYTLSLALFLLAWWLIVRRSPNAPGRARYVVAALLFFASFSTASLLLFLVVPAAHLLLLCAQTWGWSWRTAGRMLARFWFLGAAPLVFWVLRALFFQPTALYRDYNTFISLHPPLSGATRGTLLLLAMLVVLLVVVLLWRRAGSSARASGIALLVLAAGTAAVAVLMVALGGPSSAPWVAVTGLLVVAALALGVQAVRGLVTPGRAARSIGLVPVVAVGLLLVALGALPYLVVDKLPTFLDWEVRHQMLMPFGIAVLGVAAWRSLALGGRLRAIAVVGVAALALVSLAATLTLVADWRKQEAIIDALRSSDEVREVPTVVFSDQARDLNFGDRSYSTFEYHGWLATAFGDETRYGVEAAQVGEFLDADPDALEALGARYGYADYAYSTEAVRVDIVAAEGATRWDLLFGTAGIAIVVTEVDDLESLR